MKVCCVSRQVAGHWGICMKGQQTGEDSFISVCKYLKGGCKEDGARLFLVVPSARSRGIGHKLEYKGVPAGARLGPSGLQRTPQPCCESVTSVSGWYSVDDTACGPLHQLLYPQAHHLLRKEAAHLLLPP